ncbi:YdcF family protein [uncultured Thiodictyon sp.]|jgi:uncharacterized SAM-binding protein YcdF (DUF218 family)|uniref:YdcF family protein n=1 Tax=uncultured Thiodictyon sp. TaxID=1846217 RepID=UPI0025E72E38|nr:YdcF family protein [uncultured Thiodictyon sp.]
MDWLALQRLLTTPVMPLPLGLGLAFFGLVLLWYPRARRAGSLLVVGGLPVIGLASSPLVAESLMASLEGAYPPRDAAACPAADAIVLLGGAVRPRVEGDVRARLHGGSDRVWEAARLYHAGCAPRVVVSAGGRIEPPLQEPETEAIAQLLTGLGVPRSALLLESASRNTLGNAAFSRALLKPLGVDRVLLVTSAWHLRRAVAPFERAGFAVVPAGADYRSFGGCQGVQCWVPSIEALEATGLAAKEYLGYWAQAGG